MGRGSAAQRNAGDPRATPDRVLSIVSSSQTTPQSLHNYFLHNLSDQEGPYKAPKYGSQCGQRSAAPPRKSEHLHGRQGVCPGGGLEQIYKARERHEQRALRSISKWQRTSFSFSGQPFSSSVASFFLSFLFSPFFLLCSPLDKISRTINDVEMNSGLSQSAQYSTLAWGSVSTLSSILGLEAPGQSTSLK